MNILTRIKNYRFLKGILSGKENVGNRAQVEFFAKRAFKNYRDKTQCERNLVAAALKKIRNDFPYQIEGWADIKKKYDEYFEMDGAIKSLSEVKKGSYVTMFRGESYYQVDDNPYHYSTIGTIIKKPITYLYDGKYLKKVNGTISFQTFNEEWHTAFRWATQREIIDFKDRVGKYRRLNREIAEKQKEIEKLYKKQSKL